MAEYIVRETGYPGTLKQEIVGEVFRCRYCSRWNRENGYCVDFLVTDPDGYCSWAERRDDAEAD